MDFSRYGAGHRYAIVVSLVLSGMVCAPSVVHAVDNPGYDRPGLGFAPAVLQAGDVTWEQGLPDASRDHADGVTSTQYSADTLLRLGIGHALELQFGSSPYNYLRLRGDGSTYQSHGRGDTILGMKFALPARGALSWGVLGSVELTDGQRDFRSEHRQYLLGVDVNWQWNARNTAALYLENVRAGGRDSRLLAINNGYALTPALNGYVELALQDDADTGHGSRIGAGLAWMLTPRVQLDSSLRHRLGGHAVDWEAAMGLSVYFGR